MECNVNPIWLLNTREFVNLWLYYYLLYKIIRLSAFVILKTEIFIVILVNLFEII